MKNTLTLGAIWKDDRSGKEFELVAQNKETGAIQLGSIDGVQEFKCMSESSLRKHYKLIAMSLREYKPEQAVLTTQVEEELVIAMALEPVVNNQGKVEQVIGNNKESNLKVNKIKIDKNDLIGKIHFEDGKILSANEYVALHGKSGKDISGLTIHWIEKVKMAQQWLIEDKAKIVYTK